jgi:hypothetical protein
MPVKPFQPPLYRCYKQLVICLTAILSLTHSTCQAQAEDKPWSNPILIFGSNFGHIFQQLYLTGNYQKMLELTDQSSRELHCDSIILDYYKKMQFAYPIQLISHTRNGHKYQLIYKAKINATVVRLRVEIIVENDTARVILPFNLDASKHYYFGYQ